MSNFDATRTHESGAVVRWKTDRINSHDANILRNGTEEGARYLAEQHKGIVVYTPAPALPKVETGEHSGGSVDYYKVSINNPTSPGIEPYVAECNDIIEALGMNYAEGNVFKALWRSCAERTLGKKKQGNDAIYDAEKMMFFSQRVHEQRKNSTSTDVNRSTD